MTILMRIVDGEIHAKGFRSIEEGISNNQIDLTKKIEGAAGETLQSLFYNLLGVESELIDVQNVYLSEEGILYSPSFIQEGTIASIESNKVTAKRFVQVDTLD